MANLPLTVDISRYGIRVRIQVLLLEQNRGWEIVVAVHSILDSHLSRVLGIWIAAALRRMMHVTSKGLNWRADSLV
jgi:hypothetical protein